MENWITTTNPDLTAAELEAYGFLPLIKAEIISVDASGLLHWGKDGSGYTIVNGLVNASLTEVKVGEAHLSELSRLMEVFGYTSANNLDNLTAIQLHKGPTVTLTVAGGAGAAAAQVLVDSSAIAGIADGDKVYLEKLHISANCATTTDNIILTLSSSDAAPTELMRLTVNGVIYGLLDVYLDLGDAYDAANPTYGDIVAQGLAGLSPMTDNDLIYLTPYYRVI